LLAFHVFWLWSFYSGPAGITSDDAAAKKKTTKNLSSRLALAACSGSLLVSIQPVFAQGTAFTYQGQLQTNGRPAIGAYEMTFALFNASSGGTQAGGTLTNTVTGIGNTAIGVEALTQNTSGDNNTAYGGSSLASNTNGSNNIALGPASLYSNTSGHDNLAVGNLAGYNVTTGSNNIEIGNQGEGSDNNVIRLGSDQHSAFVAGIYGTVVTEASAVYVNSSGQLGVATSSARFKENIRSMEDASEVLLALHPVRFRYKPGLDPKGTPQFGPVAEEVDKVAPDLVLRDATNGIYSVRYEAVNAMLLNEFLKEHRKVEQQNAAIQEQGAKIQDLKQSVAELKQMVQSLVEKNQA
jgi:hypothetical protein